MKNVLFFVLFLAGIFSAQTVDAQAFNNTTETWQINYYGAITIVPAGAQNVPINLGTNCLAGISAKNMNTPGCGLIVPAPGSYPIGCSLFTNFIDFSGTPGALSILCTAAAPPVYGNPVFVFG